METQAPTLTDPAAEIARLRHELYITLKTLKQADRFNERYEQVVQHLDAIVLSLDTNGKILFLNDFGLKLFGYEAEELFGQQILGSLIPTTTEDSGRYLPEMLCRLLENPDLLETNENENTARDGRRYLIAWKNWAVKDCHGNLIEIASLGRVVKEL